MNQLSDYLQKLLEPLVVPHALLVALIAIPAFLGLLIGYHIGTRTERWRWQDDIHRIVLHAKSQAVFEWLSRLKDGGIDTLKEEVIKEMEKRRNGRTTERTRKELQNGETLDGRQRQENH